jgi:hypothetical protein
MLARSSTVGLLATIALSLPADPVAAPSFTLESSGALSLAVTSDEAQYGIVPNSVNHRPVLAISLGATRGDGALLLYTYADEVLRPGRYPVGPSLPEQRFAGRQFHPSFVAGSMERPLGYFHGESGWVTITATEAGRISGEFEIRARGFLAADMTDEDQWVTVQGTFSAEGDSTVTAIEAISAVTQ